MSMKTPARCLAFVCALITGCATQPAAEKEFDFRVLQHGVSSSYNFV